MSLPQLPPQPPEAPQPGQDTFDFGKSQCRAQNYVRRLLEGTKGVEGMSNLSRQHLIAVGAVGGYLIAPTIAGIRKRRRKKAARRKAADS